MTNYYQGTVGRLHHDVPHKNAGRKVADWRYFYSDLHKGNRHSFAPVVVSLHVKDGQASFTASSDSLPFDLQHTDINVLYGLVSEALEEQAQVLTGTTWEDWLEISVTGQTISGGEERISHRPLIAGDLNIRVMRLKRGIHPHTGETMTVNSNGVAVPFPTPTRLAEDPDAGGSIRLTTPRETSYVPATAENIAALQRIIERMEQLRAGLSDILSHENVGDSPNIGEDSLDLLPSP